MNAPKNDTLRDLIAKQSQPEVSGDFVARTVAAAQNIQQDPVDSTDVRNPWLKVLSLAAAAAVVFALTLNTMNTPPETETSVAISISDAEDVDLAVLVAAAPLPEDRQDMQLMLVLNPDANITDEDLLAFAL